MDPAEVAVPVFLEIAPQEVLAGFVADILVRQDVVDKLVVLRRTVLQAFIGLYHLPYHIPGFSSHLITDFSGQFGEAVVKDGAHGAQTQLAEFYVVFVGTFR